MNESTNPNMEFNLEEIEVKTDPDYDRDTQKYHVLIRSPDWKLDPNVECRVLLERLQISPSSQEFQRDSDEPAVHNNSEDSADIYLKFKLLVEELSCIFTKCEKKCGICVEYILKLCQHMAETHESDQGSDSTSSDLKCDICGKLSSTSTELISHRECHSNSESSENRPPVKLSDILNFDISPPFNTAFPTVPIIINLTSETEDFTNKSQSRINSHANDNKKKQNSVDADQESDLNCYCDICGEILSNSSEVIRHREGHSKSESSTTITPVNIPDIHNITPLDMAFANIPIIINLTSETENFDSIRFENNYSSQNTSHLNDNVVIRQESSRKFSTEVGDVRPVVQSIVSPSASFEFVSVISCSTLENNLKTGTVPATCDDASESECQEVFSSLHYSRVRKGKTSLHKLTCEKCGEDFAKRTDFTDHMISVHGEKEMNVKLMKPFKCETCGKFFHFTSHLSTHKLTHTGEKPFKCNECGKCFSRAHTLSLHKKSHTGEKPHKCEKCAKCYRSWGELNSHKKYKCGKSHGLIKHSQNRESSTPTSTQTMTSTPIPISTPILTPAAIPSPIIMPMPTTSVQEFIDLIVINVL